MKKRTIITIAGHLGSGKSSVGSMLATILNYASKSSGDYARGLSPDSKKTILEKCQSAESDPKSDFDEKIDQWVRDLASQENLIIDSRLAYHWIKDSFKVFLKVDPEEGKHRMFNNLSHNKTRKESEHANNADEMGLKRIARYESDNRRYKIKYGINYEDLTPYDLVIDTTKIDIATVVKMIVEAYESWLKGEFNKAF